MLLKNRVKFSTATTGTGAITVGTATSGFRTPSAAGFADGDYTVGVIEDGSDWEVSILDYTASGTTFARTLIESSTGSLLNLSGSAAVTLGPTADLAMATAPSRMTVLSVTGDGGLAETSSSGSHAIDFGSRGQGRALSTATTVNAVALWKFLSNGGTGLRNSPLQSRSSISCYIDIEALSTGTDEYTAEVGYHAMNAFAAIGNNGAYFIYDRATYGANWQAVCRAGAAPGTVVDSGVAVTAGSAIGLEVLYDSASRVRFKINGTQVASITTNVPSGSLGIMPGAAIRKTAGTTARRVLAMNPVWKRLV